MQDNTDMKESTVTTASPKTAQDDGKHAQNIGGNKTKALLWLGLASYQEENADIFFGRTEESDELFYKIYDNVVTTVYGVSGVGKTSLLQAGVFPKLRRKQFFPIYLRLDHRKGSAPYVKQILELIQAALEKNYCSIQEIAPLPTNASESLWTWLHRHEFYDVMDLRIRPVLVFDQFEEIFTISEKDESEINDAITQICDAAGNHLPADLEAVINKNNESLMISVQAEYRMVMSLRDDFIARLDEISAQCPSLQQNRIPVKPMSEKNAREVVLNDKTRDIISESVCNSIIKAVSENTLNKRRNSRKVVEPALLSLFCEQINSCRIEQGLPHITEKLVKENKDNILVKFYDNAMQKVSLRTREILEDELVSDAGFRLLKAVDDLEIPKEEVEKLVNLRLLRMDSRNDVKYIELCHDILIPVVKAKRAERYLQKKARFYRRFWYAVIGFIACVSCLLISTYYLFFKEYRIYYKNWINIYGIPHGFNRLNIKQVKHRDYSYEFKVKGKFNCSLKLHDYLENFRWNNWQSYIPLAQSLPYRITIVNNRLEPYPSDDQHFNTYIWSSYDSSKTNEIISISEDKLMSVVIVDYTYKKNIKDKDGRMTAPSMPSQSMIPQTMIGRNKNEEMIWGAYYNYMHFVFHNNLKLYNKRIRNKIKTTLDPMSNIAKIDDSKTNKSLLHKDIKSYENNQPGNHPEKREINGKDEQLISTESNEAQEILHTTENIPETDAQVIFVSSSGFPIRRNVLKNNGESYEVLSYVGINYYKENEESDFPGYEKEWIWIDPIEHEGTYYTRGLDNAHKRIFQYRKGEKGYDFIKTRIMISQVFKDGKFENFCDAAGNCSSRKEYDQDGNCFFEAAFDDKGNFVKITKDHGDFDTSKYDYDKYGNIIKTSFWKHNDISSVNIDSDYKEILANMLEATLDGVLHEYAYDNGISPETIEYSPITSEGICKQTRQYNQDGYKVKSIFYSMTGKGVYGNKDVMRMEQTFDPDGKINNEYYYAKETGIELACNNDGICKIDIEYDTEGKQSKKTVYSLLWHGIAGDRDVMRQEQTFNASGDILVEKHFADVKGDELACDSNGISWFENQYAAKTGKLTGSILYSIPGKGVWGDKETMRVERSFNNDGKIVEQKYFKAETDDNPACDNDGICRIKSQYDKEGHEEKRFLYSMEGKGLFGNKDILRMERTFNASSNILVEKHFADIKGDEPACDSEGISWYENQYNPKTGKLERDILYSLPGKGINGNRTIMRMGRVFNADGYEIERIYYSSEEGETTACNQEGVYKIATAYHGNGKIRQKTFHSLPGKGIMGHKDIMRFVRIYDTDENLKEEKSYDQNGNVVPNLSER